MDGTQGILTIVPTPLGNLGDATRRALDALAACDAVYAEDTRVTGRLLAAYGISKPLVRLDEAVMEERAAGAVRRVLAGERIAYCTDAGMPGVSDPGMRLVAAARSAGAAVEVLPGATAATCAYVMSGTAFPHFYFGGFFPRKADARRVLLASLARLDAALIFYESPARVAGALAAVAEAFPCRDVCVCREISKVHEEVVRGPAPEVADAFAAREGVKGEIVIVVDGPAAEEAARAGEAARDEAHELAARMAARGARVKEVARAVADACGIARNDAYAIALEAARACADAEAGRG